MLSIRKDSLLIFCTIVSVFGIFLMGFWAISPPISGDDFYWRKPLVGSLFSLICITGIFAALFPNRCSETFHFRKDNQGIASRQIHVATHHPECGKFSAHVVRIRGVKHCAACTGLFLGAVIALIGAVFYFFSGCQIGGAVFSIVLTGVVAVVVGFFQLAFSGFARLASNVLFVLGAFLCLVGIDQLTQNLAVDLFLTMLIVFWIFTRIQLSQWDHQRICNDCESLCEVGRTKKR